MPAVVFCTPQTWLVHDAVAQFVAPGQSAAVLQPPPVPELELVVELVIPPVPVLDVVIPLLTEVELVEAALEPPVPIPVDARKQPLGAAASPAHNRPASAPARSIILSWGDATTPPCYIGPS